MSSRISWLKYQLPTTGTNKKCNKCLKEKDTSLFYDSKLNKDGKKNRCISCELEYKKSYYQNNRDRIKQKVQDLYHSDIEKSRERTKNAVREFKKRNPFYYSKLKAINE